MERKLQEKVKHVDYLYDELDIKEKEIEKLKESLNYAKHLYKKQTAFAEEVLDEKNFLSLELDKKKEDIADLMQTKCGCSKYSKIVEEIADAASKHRDKLIALKEVAEAQKRKNILT